MVVSINLWYVIALVACLGCLWVARAFHRSRNRTIRRYDPAEWRDWNEGWYVAPGLGEDTALFRIKNGELVIRIKGGLFRSDQFREDNIERAVRQVTRMETVDARSFARFMAPLPEDKARVVYGVIQIIGQNGAFTRIADEFETLNAEWRAREQAAEQPAELEPGAETGTPSHPVVRRGGQRRKRLLDL